MQHEHRDLSYVPLDPPFPIRTAALLQRRGAYRSVASIAFCRLLREMLQAGDLSKLKAFATSD
jgi:LysR family cyn operon transcriptional activator